MTSQPVNGATGDQGLTFRKGRLRKERLFKTDPRLSRFNTPFNIIPKGNPHLNRLLAYDFVQIV
jgi:hypothetical protein